jgi:hypothetical protein
MATKFNVTYFHHRIDQIAGELRMKAREKYGYTVPTLKDRLEAFKAGKIKANYNDAGYRSLERILPMPGEEAAEEAAKKKLNDANKHIDDKKTVILDALLLQGDGDKAIKALAEFANLAI